MCSVGCIAGYVAVLTPLGELLAPPPPPVIVGLVTDVIEIIGLLRAKSEK